MANINPSYMLAPAIEQLFLDSVTGEALAYGQVYFYSDVNRNVLKPVYELVGTAGNYTYSALPNPVILNSVGAFPTAVYYYPFNSTGAVELYFIKVFNSMDVDQHLDREAYPNYSLASSSTTNVQTNFVSNSQFIMHTNLPETTDYDAGEIREAVTPIAYGGWTFETTEGSTSDDFVTFIQEPSYSDTNPPDSPRYIVQIECTNPGGDPGSRQDLCLNFPNVNQFASDTITYTYGFWSESLISGSINIQIIVRKNFGTGGSTTTETPVGTASISNSGQYYWFNFKFGDNLGQTVSTLNDDYVQVVVRMPTDNLYEIQFTDFMLVQGAQINAPYPISTDIQDVAQSLGGGIMIPDFTGLDLGLPLILSPTGITYDMSIVGQAAYYTGLNIPDYWRLMDGSSNLYSDIWDEGVPKSRLGNVLWDTTNLQYIYGGGYSYANSIANTTTSIILYNNQSGIVTSSAVNTSGFTISDIYASLGGNKYSVDAYKYSATSFYAFPLYVGTVTNAWTAGNVGGGFTVTNVRYINTGTQDPTVSPYIWSVTAIAGSAITASHYWEFSTLNSSSVQTDYYMWFTINGAGTDPMISMRTAVKCNLLSTDSATDVATKIMIAINDLQGTYIIPVAGSSITAGNYWTFYTTDGMTAQEYVVWYTVAGVGTQPTVAGSPLYIPVNVLSTDTAAMVTTETMTAINKYTYGLPDPQGYFVRVLDTENPSFIDPNNQSRYSPGIPSFYGAYPGTAEFDEILSHNHYVGVSNANESGSTNAVVTGASVPSTFYGSIETRPKNIAFTMMIHI